MGNKWLETFLERLEGEDKARVKEPETSKRIFCFGNGEKQKSEGEYTLPGRIYGAKIMIKLLSKKAMKNMGIILDRRTDEVEIVGTRISLSRMEHIQITSESQQFPGSGSKKGTPDGEAGEWEYRRRHQLPWKGAGQEKGVNRDTVTRENIQDNKDNTPNTPRREKERECEVEKRKKREMIERGVIQDGRDLIFDKNIPGKNGLLYPHIRGDQDRKGQEDQDKEMERQRGQDRPRGANFGGERWARSEHQKITMIFDENEEHIKLNGGSAIKRAGLS